MIELMVGNYMFCFVDGVVLSWLNIFGCKYVVEVIVIDGVILIVVIVWLWGVDENLRKDIESGIWCFYKFLSFVGYKWIVVVLKIMVEIKFFGWVLFDVVVGSF